MPSGGTGRADDAGAVSSPAGRVPSCMFGEDYVRKLIAGDRDVEDHFTAYFGELLTIKLRARVRSGEMIEDIRQETLVRVLHALRQKDVQRPERLGSFVNKVCDNVMFESFRAVRRFSQIDPEHDDWVDGGHDPLARLIDQERQRLVERVLAKLPTRYREVLRLVFLEEVSMTEACQRLGVGQSNGRVVLHRAKVRFRDEWTKLGEPDGERFASRDQEDPVKRSGGAVHYKVRYSDGT
jgi:RNA polymerase sigma-70 factor (ECF subfamily)